MASIEARKAIQIIIHGKYFGPKVAYAVNNLSQLDTVDQRMTDDLLIASSILIGLVVCGLSSILFNAFLFGIYSFAECSWFVASLISIYYVVFIMLQFFLTGRIAVATMAVAMAVGELRFIVARTRLFAEAITFYGGERMELAAYTTSAKNLYKKQMDFLWAFLPMLIITIFALFVGGSLITLYVVIGQVSSSDWVYRMDNTDDKLTTNILILSTFGSTLGVVAVILMLVPVAFGICNRVGQVEESATYFSNYNELVLLNHEEGPIVEFDNVIIETPDHTKTLAHNLTFNIPAGDSLVVRGQSGSGKSSILKVLAGLWACSGTIRRPMTIGRGGIFFVPQQSYTTIGTLRDQVTYPHDEQMYPEESHDSQEKDDFITEILNSVNLGYLTDAWGLDTEVLWDDTLSGGEAQRLGFARLFYHLPKYAIMDESTSALDEELQETVMQLCVDKKISMISVAHRPELFRWHSHALDMVGEGETAFSLL